MKKSTLITLIILGVLIIDQALKIYIKTHYTLGQSTYILGQQWAQLHFVENEGMAFGLSFGGSKGKLFLSLFRILMVGLLIYIIRGLIKAKESTGLLISFAFIIAGAIGNIVDSAFYGIIFSESTFHGEVAHFVTEGLNFSKFLHGKVVDMFYFPMINGRFPDWFPFWGGESFEFFRPVFNVADTSISIGVISIILFHRSFFKGNVIHPTKTEPTAAVATAAIIADEEE